MIKLPRNLGALMTFVAAAFACGAIFWVAGPIVERVVAANSPATSTPTSGDQANAATATASKTVSAMDALAASPTATMSRAYITVSQTTNCRSGPRGDYSYVTEINAGEEVEVLMTFPGNEYVVVDPDPDRGPDCWLWLRYADQDDFSGYGLPVATQPPTSTPTPTNTPTPSSTPSFTPTATQTASPTP